MNLFNETIFDKYLMINNKYYAINRKYFMNINFEMMSGNTFQGDIIVELTFFDKESHRRKNQSGFVPVSMPDESMDRLEADFQT